MNDDSFFNPHQRATIEAAMSRIIPSDDMPGAREAGAADFVDRYLSGIGYIYAKPDGSGFETLEGKRAEAWRQRIAILRQTYQSGIEALDALANKLFGANFVALGEQHQDDSLTALERAGSQAASAGGAPGEGPALQQTLTETELEFFPLLVMHARQGFYADPIYGGNRDRAGWRSISFPGPSSLMEVYAGRYSALQWFAPGEAEKYLEANRDA
jgi:gluconate 2-dehydrogenase gamma chain